MVYQKDMYFLTHACMHIQPLLSNYNSHCYCDIDDDYHPLHRHNVEGRLVELPVPYHNQTLVTRYASRNASLIDSGIHPMPTF